VKICLKSIAELLNILCLGHSCVVASTDFRPCIEITENGKISARGRLNFKRIRNPTKTKENLGAPSGRLLLLGGRSNNKRP